MSIELKGDVLRAITGRLPYGWTLIGGHIERGLVCVRVRGFGKSLMQCDCGDLENCPPVEYVGRMTVTHECESVSGLMDDLTATIMAKGLPAGSA